MRLSNLKNEQQHVRTHTTKHHQVESHPVFLQTFTGWLAGWPSRPLTPNHVNFPASTIIKWKGSRPKTPSPPYHARLSIRRQIYSLCEQQQPNPPSTQSNITQQEGETMKNATSPVCPILWENIENQTARCAVQSCFSLFFCYVLHHSSKPGSAMEVQPSLRKGHLKGATGERPSRLPILEEPGPFHPQTTPTPTHTTHRPGR